MDASKKWLEKERAKGRTVIKKVLIKSETDSPTYTINSTPEGYYEIWFYSNGEVDCNCRRNFLFKKHCSHIDRAKEVRDGK